VVAVAFRSLLRVCSGSSGAYNLTVRSSRRRFMASCYLSASGCCRFGCTSLRRGLTQVLGAMRTTIAMLVTAALLMTTQRAAACTIFWDDRPDTIFQKSDSVFLAYPLKISPDPDEIQQLRPDAFFQQTVIWRVVRSWKGNLSAGDTVVTVRSIDRMDACSGWSVTTRYDPRILYSSGDASPAVIQGLSLEDATLQLNRLVRRRQGVGK